MASTPLPHTLGHVHCPACEAERYEALRVANSADLPFREAARLWLINSREDVSAQTHKDRQTFINRLNKFFGPILVRDIHIGNVNAYQKARQGKADHAGDNLGEAGAELINHEISALRRVLEKAGLWAVIKPHYKPLKVPKYGPGRACSDDERERLLMCAASNPRWKVAYLCSLLSLNVGRGFGEFRKIKVKDIDLRNRNLSIDEGAKNDYRIVDFPMTDSVHWACGQLLKRYYRLCEKSGVAPSPDHYVMPARIQRGYGRDFYKPQGHMRKVWRSICDKAGITDLRLYDLRHDTATRLGESPDIADQSKRDILGHVNKRMEKRYFHQQRQTKLRALESIEVAPAPKLVETVDGFVQIPVIPAKKVEK